MTENEIDIGVSMTKKRINESEKNREGKIMGYSDIVRKALEEKKAKDISFTIFKFENPGDTLTGEMVGFDKITIPKPDGTGESEVFQYRILTDDGPVSTVLGFSGDKSIKDNDVRNGDVLSITYTGQKELDKGRRVNLYNIVHVPRGR